MGNDDPWAAGEGDVISFTVPAPPYTIEPLEWPRPMYHSDWVFTPIHTTVEELEAFFGIPASPTRYRPIPKA